MMKERPILNMELQSKYRSAGYYLVLLVLSVFFVSFFCLASSPFTFQYVGDSSIFMLLGKMFVEGKVPYLDFFDHKGPSLILLEAIGQWIAPFREGVYILEIVNLFLALIIVGKIADLLLCMKGKLTLILLFLLFFSHIVTRGNTTEEFSLIPNLLSLYIACKYFFETRSISAKDGFVIGLCFSFLLWMRMNNAGPIVAICIFMFFAALADKDYKSLTNLVAYFILGQLPFSVLYLGYFIYHDALSEMTYATFLFNFKYVSSFFKIEGEAFEINIIVFVLLTLGSILFYRKTKDKRVFGFSILMFVLCYFTINIGYAFAHYFIIMSPAFILGCLLILFSLEKKVFQNITLGLAAFAFIALGLRAAYYVTAEGSSFKQEAKNNYESIHQVLDVVPAAEKDRVYYYGVDPSFYLLAEVTSNYKYFVLQEWHGRHDEEILKEINNRMNSVNPPLWVLIEGGETTIDGFYNVDFINIIKNDYIQEVAQNGLVLYKRKQKDIY